MKISLYQMNAFWEDKSSNLELVESAAKFAAGNACDILVLPEMTLTGFSMKTSVTAEPPKGHSEQVLANIARLNNIALIAGLVEKRDSGYANTALAFDSNGALITKYSKTHLFPLSGEPNCHIPGDGADIFNIAGISATLAICYDLRFPELFRKVASRTSIIFIIANWPATRTDHWLALLKARAIENQCFVAGVNRTGTDPDGTQYSGDSAIFAPDGTTVDPLLNDGANLLFEIDPNLIPAHRKQFPFLNP